MGLDLVGPMEAFASAHQNSQKAGKEACYRVTIAALEGKTFRSEFGLTITAEKSLFDIRDVDTFLIPGGSGLRESNGHHKLTVWLQKNAGSIRRIASICTGIYGLAPSGLLNGRQGRDALEVHWRSGEALSHTKGRFRLALRKGWEVLDRRGSDGGHRSFAGSDRGGLRLGGSAFGRARTGRVHEEVRRTGAVFGAAAVSSTIAQPHCGSFAVDDWRTWSTIFRSRRLRLGFRCAHGSFRGALHRSLGSSPASFVRRLRLDEARRRLSAPECTMEGVACSVGFSDGDNFRRAFERSFGIAPSAYRGRFPARHS